LKNIALGKVHHRLFLIFRIHDEVPYAKLRCMIDDKSGVLESSFDSRNLCYFELEDVNVEPSVNFKDLVALMVAGEGIRVRYQVTPPKTIFYEDALKPRSFSNTRKNVFKRLNTFQTI